jgi:hypothetical protein
MPTEEQEWHQPLEQAVAADFEAEYELDFNWFGLPPSSDWFVHVKNSTGSLIGLLITHFEQQLTEQFFDHFETDFRPSADARLWVAVDESVNLEAGWMPRLKALNGRLVVCSTATRAPLRIISGKSYQHSIK